MSVARDPRAGPVPAEAPDLSVVLPAYRAAALLRRNVPRLSEHLRRLGVSHEILVVDDGSDDGGETARAAAELGCTLLTMPANRGKGAAVRRGMLAARGRCRIFTDADVPYELSSIDAALHYLDEKGFHMVAGDRTLDESAYFHRVPWLRRWASHAYSHLVGRLVTTGWYDTQCGFKGFRALVAEDLFGVARIDRFAFDVELFYIALKRNYDIKRVPVRLRANETSTVNVARDGAAMVRDLAVIRWNQFRGRYRPRTPLRRYIDDRDAAPPS